jgi:protein-tyrosine kinase
VFIPEDSTDQDTPPRDATRYLGAILVEAGRLRPADITEIREYAQRCGLRFGEAAVQLHRITPDDVEFALGQQFDLNLLHARAHEVFHESIVVAHDPQSPVTEQLRTIRTRLLRGWLGTEKSANRRNMLAITSAQRGEGRSWFAANIAILLAQAGKRTLLIDADLRNPRQHDLFRLKNDVGLSTVLNGFAGGEVAQQIHPGFALFVMSAGALPPNPQELLSRRRLDAVLAMTAEQFDAVVFDTPALSQAADAEVLASHAGAAVLLARTDATSAPALESALRSLERSGAALIGSVLNNF